MTDTSERHIVEFDHHSPRFRDDNAAVIRELHGTGCPLGFSEHHGGFWAIYGYDAVYDAVQDPELFSSAHRPPEQVKGVPATTTPTPFVPIDHDGPEVQDYRRVVLSRFSPSGAKADEPRIREIATELIDAFIERGRADLTQELLTPLPAILILEMMGWPTESYREWVSWVHAMIHDRTSDVEAAQIGTDKLFSAMAELIATHEPGDTLLDQILQAQADGVLSEDQVMGYCFLLIIAGMDTTAGLTGNVIEQLAHDHELRQRLIDDPGLLEREALEEFLRHDSPSYGLYRTVMHDTKFHGQSLRKGDRAILMFPAAGLDPAAYDDPGEIRFDREGNRHMAFGLGAHRCLGSHHARVMFRVMVEEILRRLPDFEIDGEPTRFADAGDVFAHRNLPVTFTPGATST